MQSSNTKITTLFSWNGSNISPMQQKTFLIFPRARIWSDEITGTPLLNWHVTQESMFPGIRTTVPNNKVFNQYLNFTGKHCGLRCSVCTWHTVDQSHLARNRAPARQAGRTGTAAAGFQISFSCSLCTAVAFILALNFCLLNESST